MKTRLNRFFSSLAIAGLSLGASTCTHIPMDSSAQAAVSNDFTVQFQGLGVLSQKGYLFVQKRESTLPTDTLAIVVPKLNCKREACTSFQFFQKDGSPGFAGGVKKGETIFQFKLSDLLGSELALTPSQDGEYSAVLELFALDQNGNELSTTMLGFIRLNVLAPQYTPMGCDDPNVAFKTKVAPGCFAQFSTVGRSATCGKCRGQD